MATVEELRLSIKAEVADAVSKLKQYERQVKETEQGNHSLAKSFASMRDAMQGPVAIAKDIARALGAVIKIGTEYYDAFANAEKSAIIFNQALKDNGEMSYGAEQRLSDYAAQLQATTQFEGDATVAIMGNLAAQGKSEEQIKKLIEAATNLAAATGIDLNTAVTQLSSTLEGSTGKLGRTNSAIKALTEDELKQGKAIEVINKQYAGMAEVVGTSAFGASEKLKNSMGDLKEAMGKAIATNFQPMIDNLTEAANKSTQAINNELDIQAALRGKLVDPARIKQLIEYQKLTDAQYNAASEAMGMAQQADTAILNNLENRLIASEELARLDKKTKGNTGGQAVSPSSGLTKAELEAIAKAEKKVWEMSYPSEQALEMVGAMNFARQKYLQFGEKKDISFETLNAGATEFINTYVAGLQDSTIETDKNTTATEKFTEAQKSLMNAGVSGAAAMAEAFGAALFTGEEGWKAFGKAGLNAIASVVEALAAAEAAKGIAALGTVAGAPLAPGYFAAAAGLYAASGAIKAIPLAEGGIVTKPTYALIGEAGPEAVVPLGKGGGMGVTIIQNIAGSVIAERALQAMAVNAVARASRGY